METRILQIHNWENASESGHFSPSSSRLSRLERWTVRPDSLQIPALSAGAKLIRTGAVPVAFPTETVYGLGADATRGDAVRGIYAAKGRPSDNPLIVHVCDLEMLRELLRGPVDENASEGGTEKGERSDVIPAIYRPVIEKFWPGPLTILMPNPAPSRLAPEVTAGLPTFGVRMPSSPLALSLIRLAGVPIAAPSANASTKPSPTTAQHVLDDLAGRIELVLDGGACDVGVESTVVDGLCDPPAVLRPGGVGIEELRACLGWEGVVRGYKDACEAGRSGAAPRAPGMKYKHYSPRARVVLYEAGFSSEGVRNEDVTGDEERIGIIRTERWREGAGLKYVGGQQQIAGVVAEEGEPADGVGQAGLEVGEKLLMREDGSAGGAVLDICLGRDTGRIAKGLFAALRELDGRGADVIFVEGIADEGDIAAAVMNRLRKAASEIRAEKMEKDRGG